MHCNDKVPKVCPKKVDSWAPGRWDPWINFSNKQPHPPFFSSDDLNCGEILFTCGEIQPNQEASKFLPACPHAAFVESEEKEKLHQHQLWPQAVRSLFNWGQCSLPTATGPYNSASGAQLRSLLASGFAGNFICFRPFVCLIVIFFMIQIIINMRIMDPHSFQHSDKDHQ